jgi:amino acid permease
MGLPHRQFKLSLGLCILPLPLKSFIYQICINEDPRRRGQKKGPIVAECTSGSLNVEEPSRDISGDIIDDGLRRGLKGRHFVIIALGSIIGPGCLYGMGYGMFEAGPIGLLIGFVITSISMWLLIQSVGEVATLFPVLCRPPC